jgi:exopolyphosphatase/guanosine-5'-triphosphate,3'-diphosphate pyrophosphatase
VNTSETFIHKSEVEGHSKITFTPHKYITVKFAAIDIGSNAIRLLIEEVHMDGKAFHIEKVSLTRVPVRLGEDVFKTGKISEEKIRQLSKTMRAFWYLMDVHKIEMFRACATSAMREASNSKEVIERVATEANISIELLTGEAEAELIFSNYFAQNLNHEANYLYIDVGGGSTELTLIKKGKKIKGESFDLGTVRMLTGTVKKSTWEKAKKWIESEKINKGNLIAIGTGGNINTIFKIQGKKPNETINIAEIKDQYNALKALTFDQRITRMRLRPDRADVILPACEIYLKLMDYAGINNMLVPKIGLADGIILDIFQHWKDEFKRKADKTEVKKTTIESRA